MLHTFIVFHFIFKCHHIREKADAVYYDVMSSNHHRLKGISYAILCHITLKKTLNIKHSILQFNNIILSG